jgi:accessory gene regulator protein AgrB
MQMQPIIIQNAPNNSLGIASFIFGLISIFILSPIFVPLAVIVGTIAVIKKQYSWGILGLVCAVIGFLTSPILLGLLGLFTFGSGHQAYLSIH